jgi:hypothetical protein
MLTYPIAYGTDVGESDEVEIVRISPIDANMIKGEGYASRKLAGTKLGNFGAFFNRNWRENDMVWGRLDAVECLIKAVWPEGEDITERDRFINEAHDIIIEEFMVERPRGALLHAISATRPNLKKRDLEEAVSSVLEDKNKVNRFFRTLAGVRSAPDVLEDKKKLIQFFRKEYEPEPDFPADSTVQAAARSTTVLGKLMGGLSEKYPVVSEPAGILTRTGRFVFFVLSLAIPRSLPAQLFRRLSISAYVLGFSIMTIGTILTQWNLAAQGAAWSRLGARLVVLTLVIQLLAMIANRFMTSRWDLKTTWGWIKTSLWILLAILIVLVLVAILVASYSGLLYLGVWEPPAGSLGRFLEALRNILNR